MTHNHRIQKFTRKGKFISTWGEFGEDFSQFNIPWGIEVDEKGDVTLRIGERSHTEIL
ncbi:MAG: hypothetical protein CM1200mP38_4810 [Dehalococcoidia bacterium]|nr:MAG: hypothetical protein CM1200mP38_4810 [Dehalococcoidia bacterium]